MPLDSYNKKRDFSRTREPATGEATGGNPTFVVQKHAARRLHYDVRLEMDGVLKSWAVPRGPSLNPDDKRMAVFVEDHPLDYAGFEGVIGHGNYGAGQVIVWDAGVYSPDEGGLSFGDRAEAEERMAEGLAAGKLSFTLRGRKLRGSWTLVRTSKGPKEWLLIKHRDEHADADHNILAEERSILSALTLDDMKAGRLPDREEPDEPDGRPAKMPRQLKPMLARMADNPFSNPDWIFEPKLDGHRATAYLNNGVVTLRSRTGRDITGQFPEVVDELQAQPGTEWVLDGEIVALNDDGLPDFGILQRHLDPRERGNLERLHVAPMLVYYPFDLAHLDGRSFDGVPLRRRKALLERAVIPGERVKLVDYVAAEGEMFFDAVTGMGLEGMVAKRADSMYEPGARSAAWIKVKAIKSQEFIVGGYTKGEGARASTFGALLLGHYEDGVLRYAGRVGSGFDSRTLEALSGELGALRVDESPFGDGEEIDVDGPMWVRPELVAQTKFSQWTDENRLRAPVFLWMMPDVDPATVTRDAAVAVPPSRPRVSEPNAVTPASQISDAVAQLSGDEDTLDLELDGHRVHLTNLRKTLWPEGDGHRAVTKGEMIRYYVRMAPVLLGHLRDRPLTLTRYPNGITGESFYQKHYGHELPGFVETVDLFSSHNEGDGEYILVNNLPTLVWLAQLADLELHPWLSRVAQQPDATHLTTDFTGSREALEGSVLNYPDFINFDLDPYIYSGDERPGDEPELNRRAFSKGAEVALALKEVLDQLSLSSFVKTSGKTGLHIYVPVLRRYDFKSTRKTCELIGRFLMERKPQDVTMQWTIEKRAGKIFLDHNQNVRGKNMASIYSLRPLMGAPVSTPLRWDELEDVYPTQFTIDTVPDRIEQLGDLWAGVLDAKHDLGRLLGADA